MPVQPDGRSLHINQALNSVSTAYIQRETNFIAPQVFPVVPVSKQGDVYWTYNKGDWFRSVAGVRAPATESPGAGWEVSQAPYYAPVYAVHKDLDDQTIANADNVFNLDRDAAEWVTMNLLIKRERIFMDSYMKTGVWGTTLTGVGAAPAAGQFLRWDVAGSTPILDINRRIVAMAGATGYRPNTLVIGPEVEFALQNNASIIDLIKYTQRGVVTNDLLASLFNVDRVLTTWAVENVAPQGAADVIGFQNSKTALLCYTPRTPSLLQPAAGYTFAWTGLLGAGAMGTAISRFRMEAIKSYRVEGEMAFSMNVIGSDLGVFFDQAVS